MQRCSASSIFGGSCGCSASSIFGHRAWCQNRMPGAVSLTGVAPRAIGPGRAAAGPPLYAPRAMDPGEFHCQVTEVSVTDHLQARLVLLRVVLSDIGSHMLSYSI